MNENSLANLKPFKPGQSGNPGGLNSETHRLIKENAERAARIQHMLLEGLEQKLEQASPDEREAVLRADVNKIVSDALDRHLGKPTQPQEITSPDGSAAPSVIRIVAVTSDKSENSAKE